MRVHCIIVLFIVTKNVFSSNPSREKRQTQPNLTLDNRRHRISQSVPFPDFTETKQIDCFPETEYLTSVLETKPFFYQSNDILEPFQDDVKSSFKSIVSKTNQPKVFTTIKPKIRADAKKAPLPVTSQNNETKILEDKSNEHVNYDLEDEIATVAEFTSIKHSTVHDDVNSQTAADNATKILEDKSNEHFDDEIATITEFTSIEHPTTHDNVNSQISAYNAKKILEDKSNEHVDYDFDDEIATIAEFTSIEHSTAHDDVNSQMAADDSFSEISDETFYLYDASNASKGTPTSSSSNTTDEYEDQVPVPLLLSETEEPIIFG